MKMMRWLSRKKLNNKGMSLVEIIVAVAVFTVVAIPVMKIFASSNGTNFRSRDRQRATLVGEAIMESFKAFDMEAMVAQVVTGTYNGVKFTGTAPTVVAYVGGSEVSPLLGDGKLRRDADSIKFTFDNIEADGMKLNAEIIATPKEEGQLLRMESPNAYSDAIYSLDHKFNNDLSAHTIEQSKAALMSAKPSVALSDISDDITIKDFHRVTTFTVSDDAGVQKVTMKMSCTANAEMKYEESVGVDKEETVPLSFNVKFELEDGSKTEEILIYDNTNTIAGEDVKGDICKLDNVYFYFSPAYECFFGDNPSEEFVIEGELNSLYDAGSASAAGVDPESVGRLPLKICLVKQKYNGIDDAKLNNEEMGYSAKVTSNISGSGEVILAHNFNENLVGPTGSVMTPVPTSGFADVQTYSFNAAEPYKCGFAGEVELLYDLKISLSKVEKDGTASAVATFEGTVVN
ncbi:MAG: prepilin-type N-terminal cleavage/methylation domain-containing protein [Lachnospiraceae bacterium]|nr:prepilin-type N-terminal cleavage/methylation domain-containing protein [Lachnospiraceae bacterium]